MKLRNHNKHIKKANSIPNTVFDTIAINGGTAVGLTKVYSATVSGANHKATTQTIGGVSTVATGVFRHIAIPINVPYVATGAIWASGNGSYLFIRCRGVLKSGVLV